MIIQLMKWWNDKHDQCPECEGRKLCESCEGNGTFDHHGYEYDCQMCGTVGKCEACEGHGTWVAYDRVQSQLRQKEMLKKRYGTSYPKDIHDYWVNKNA